MLYGTPNETTIETVPLQNAVLCVDCESVSNSRSNECPVCGSHSLLGLAGMLGGTLVDYQATGFHKQKLVLFDLHITIELTQMEGEELSSAIESITRIVAPKLGRGSASLHIAVEPVSENDAAHEMRAA